MNPVIEQVQQQLNLYLQIEAPLSAQGETLHELRVAARQLLSLFPKEEFQRQLFKRIIQASNKIRDLDVLLLDILPKIAKEFTPQTREDLEQNLLAARALLDDEFKSFLQLDVLPELIGMNPQQMLRAQTAMAEGVEPLEQIEKHFRQLRKRLLLVDLEEEQIHKIRLKVKRLRYQMAHHYPQEPLLDTLTFVQHQLGHFHDYAQARKLIQRYASSLDTKTRTGLKKHLQSRQDAVLKKVRNTLKKETT
ncbi:MAG: CHAD domain-containing protein [Thiotrichales bacterium]|nr:CHAD domain-containing protein [Thiotrichales bacterium]